MLLVPFALWATSCVASIIFFARRAPSVSVALAGSVAGAFVGFVVGNADGPAEVPAHAAVGASVGLFAAGFVGFVAAPPRRSARNLGRAGALVLAVAPPAAAVLTILLHVACPLYVTGPGSGYCDFQDVDVLGGWITGVIVAFLADAVFVSALLFVSAWRARRAGDAPEGRPLSGRSSRGSRPGRR